MADLIVLGAAGWVGRAVLDAAIRRGAQPIGLARRPGPGLILMTEPARQLAALLAREQPLAVINAAGRVRATDAVLTAERLAADNVALAGAVAEAAAEAGVRLVHLGSAAEYGDPGPQPVHEDTEARPLDAYGHTKAAGTAAVLARRAAGADCLVARLFNLVGDRLAAGSPLREFVEAARSGHLTLRNAATTRDFVSLGFAADAAVALALDPRPSPFGLVNVSSGIGRSYGELGRALLDLHGGGTLADLGEPVIATVVGDASRLATHYGLAEALDLDDLARRVVAAATTPPA